MQNSVFLGTLLYKGTACSQKTENAKSTADSMSAVLFLLMIIENDKKGIAHIFFGVFMRFLTILNIISPH